MKETQEKLQFIINTCNNLMKELDDMQVTEGAPQINFEALCKKARNFKYQSEELENLDEGTKLSFIMAMLLAVREIQDMNAKENALLHVAKLCLAMKVELNLEEYYLRSLKLVQEDMNPIIDDMTKMPLVARQIFALEAVHLLVVSGCTDDNVLNDMASIIGLTGLELGSIDEVVNLNKHLLSADVSEFRQFANSCKHINLFDFQNYIKDVLNGSLACNDSIFWINGNATLDTLHSCCYKEEKEETLCGGDIKKYFYNSKEILIESINAVIKEREKHFFSGERAIIKNCNFDCGKTNDFSFIFSGFEALKFVNCIFKNAEDAQVISINGTKHVTFQNCSFLNSSFTYNRMINIKEAEDVKLSKCDFRNNSVVRESSYTLQASCFDINARRLVRIEECSFEECIAHNRSNNSAEYPVGLIKGTQNIQLTKCSFIKCKTYGRGYETRKYSTSSPIGVERGTKIDTQSCTSRDNSVDTIYYDIH